MIQQPVRLADRDWKDARQQLEIWVREATRELLRLVATWDPTRESVQAAVDTLDTDKVPTSRVIATSAPLTGGGNLGADLALALDQSGITHNNLGGRSTATAHPGTAVTNTPSGWMVSTTVQAAIDELMTGVILSRGGSLISLAGLASGASPIVWYATYACRVVNVRGYRVGGTGATVNAQKNGASKHLSGDLSLTSADVWMDGGAVQNTDYAIGDKMQIMVPSVAGGPTQVAVQVDLRRI